MTWHLPGDRQLYASLGIIELTQSPFMASLFKSQWCLFIEFKFSFSHILACGALKVSVEDIHFGWINLHICCSFHFVKFGIIWCRHHTYITNYSRRICCLNYFIGATWALLCYGTVNNIGHYVITNVSPTLHTQSGGLWFLGISNNNHFFRMETTLIICRKRFILKSLISLFLFKSCVAKAWSVLLTPNKVNTAMKSWVRCKM